MKWITLGLVAILGILTNCSRTQEQQSQLQAFCTSHSGVAASPDIPLVASANNKFGLALNSKFSNVSGNLFLSGYSIGSALSMLHVGAQGKTAEQIAGALQISGISNYDSANASLRSQAVCGAINKGYEMRVANSLWTQDGFSLLPNFVSSLTDNYAAQSSNLDFANPNAPQTINQWVSQETKGLIPKLLDSFDSWTRLVLVNAIYFKAKWATPFRPESTSNDTFYLNGSTPSAVPMMHSYGDLKYARGTGYDVVELPYADQGFAMDIILPSDRNGVISIEKDATDELVSVLGSLQMADVQLSLPKFKFKTSVKSPILKPVLEAMGILDVFSPGSADLSGIAGIKGLYLSDIVHETAVEVDETGTEAAAATGGVVGPTSAPSNIVVFKVDHPFLFIIRDLGTGAIIFMGRVVNPSAN